MTRSIKKIDAHVPRTRGNSRDTRRWCKGRPGIEHIYHWVTWFSHPAWIAQHQRCATCGRIRSASYRRVWPDGSITES